jgi:hypothetical protein
MIVALAAASLLILLLITIISAPYIIYRLYSRRAKRITEATTEAYYPYRAATYLLNQMGYSRGELTPLQFAGQVVDRKFGTSFEAFTAIYQRAKYAGQPLSTEEIQRIVSFYAPFEQTIKAKIGKRHRFVRFMNIYNTLEFFTSKEY